MTLLAPDAERFIQEPDELRVQRIDFERGGGANRAQSCTAISTISLTQFLATKLPEREVFLSPWLRKQSLTMVYAWRGTGKTLFMLSVAYAIASGNEFLGWQASKARKVLYLDGEMPGPTIQERLALIVNSFPRECEDGFFRLATIDLQAEGMMPDLSTEDGQSALDNVIGDAEVIVIDNLSCLVRRGRENEAESWEPIATWALRHRAKGRALIFVHHTGKDGKQRGTSKREDILNTSIKLCRPDDADPTDGAVFEIHFEKARDLYGSDVTAIRPKRRQRMAD
jgi:hypothetical protein